VVFAFLFPFAAFLLKMVDSPVLLFVFLLPMVAFLLAFFQFFLQVVNLTAPVAMFFLENAMFLLQVMEPAFQLMISTFGLFVLLLNMVVFLRPFSK